ncbi:hypothetical protein Poly51_57720 [Rubripirellula tenax]|uniref:Leucine Rich repeats (2 copies) n=1 Tax=Rubripirellula tenax TaxID=2528015 RepID=A0A5C6EFJ8_9BACT|nr:hypothetical protein [Rubripirellula tenax]TWU46376.1 hypothetical protein Poly51_57720 [Rubripirellula tenax]
MKPSENAAKVTEAAPSLQRQTWQVGLLVVAITVLSNLPYKYANSANSGYAAIESVVDFPIQMPPVPRMAGWPFRYLIQYPSDDAYANRSPVSRFAVVPLAMNLGLALLVAITLAVYSRRRSNRGQTGVRTLSIGDLLVLTTFLAIGFAWWQHLGSLAKRDADLQQRIRSAGGGVAVSAWVPQFLAERIPSSLRDRLVRIHSVRIEHPKIDLLQSIFELNELQVVRVGGNEFDESQLHSLGSNPHIFDLRVAGRPLDAGTIEMIQSLPNLRTLNLMRTSVDAQDIQGLTGIERLNLIHSDVRPSEIERPEWSRSLVELRIGHPGPGGEPESLLLSDWPRLKTLAVEEFDTLANSDAMTVRLQRMPMLEEVRLDTFQKFALELGDLPKLTKLSDSQIQWEARVPRGGKSPGQIWCSTIEIRNAPEFEELYFFMPDMERLILRETPKFKGAFVGAYYKTYRNQPYETNIKPAAIQAVLEGLGASDGPELIDLDAVPLANADLSPLAKNARIRDLRLSQTGTTLKQWKSLEDLTELVRLDLHESQSDEKALGWILDTFPKLQHLSISPKNDDNFFMRSNETTLEIVDHASIRELDLKPFSTEIFGDVRIFNSPSLSIALSLGYVRKLEIIGANSIAGLSLQSPFPENATIERLDSANFFAVGGPGVTDKTTEAIEGCKTMDTLTLAYPNLSTEAIERLPIGPTTSSLSLPGTLVTDEIALKWPKLPFVKHLDFRDTAITEKTINHLCSGGIPYRMVLDRTKVDVSDISKSMDFSQLKALSLANVNIGGETMKRILKDASLEYLNLSGNTLDDDLLSALIASAGRLEILVMRDCTVDEKKFTELANQTRIVFDIDGTDFPTALMTRLLSSQRIVEVEQWQMQKAITQQQQSGQSMQWFRFGAAPTDALIDIDRFADLYNQVSAPEPL